MTTILVTGATGHVGHHVVAGLLDAGVTVKALARDPERAGLPTGVTAIKGDLTDPGSLRAATAGADAVFLLWPFLSADGADAAVEALAGHAVHIVYLSAIAAEDGVWGRVEHAVQRHAARWTFLRAGGFATNTLGWAAEIRERGAVRWAYGAAARSLIHERDIADVAVAALTDAKHTGATYVLTGPETITQADQVRIIGEVVGQPVRWDEAPAEETAGLMAAFISDRAFADHAVEYWASLVARPELVTGEVERVTGNPARPFREWAVEHAAEFRPRTPAEIAGRYAGLLRDGDLASALSLLAPDVVRVAPLEPAGGGAAGLRGVEAIMENARAQVAGREIRNVTVDGPYPWDDRFAVRFTFDEDTAKISLYTVRDGAIVREEVYYHTVPHGVIAGLPAGERLVGGLPVGGVALRRHRRERPEEGAGLLGGPAVEQPRDHLHRVADTAPGPDGCHHVAPFGDGQHLADQRQRVGLLVG